MTIAYDKRGPALAVQTRVSSQKPYRLWQPVHFGVALLTRAGWHLRAYGTIGGILLLIGLSLVVLQIHGLYESSLARFDKQQN